MIIQADYHKHHALLTKFARQSKYTKDFSNHIFSGEAMYQKNWIRANMLENDIILGFTCVRHKIRTPVTELYFILVDDEFRGLGVGIELLRDIFVNSPHSAIELNCAKENEAGLRFYECLKAKNIGESLGGKGIRFRIEKEQI